MTITLKDIDKRVSTVAKMGTDYNLFIHETALMIVRHAAPVEASTDCVGSGDCTRAVKLVRAMPASMRRKMLIEWFSAYTPIRIKLSDQGDKCEYDPKYKALKPEDKASKWLITEAAETAFYDIAEKVPEDKTYDLAALIEMVARIGKQIQGKLDDGKVKEDAIDGANALIRAVSGIKLPTILKADNANSDTHEKAAA